MKVVFCLIVCLSVALALPQREGPAFTNDAIKQAQSSHLIPHDAQIQDVQTGIELAAYENIPGAQKVNLQEILGAEVPFEVISNLQGQIDNVGRN